MHSGLATFFPQKPFHFSWPQYLSISPRSSPLVSSLRQQTDHVWWSLPFHLLSFLWCQIPFEPPPPLPPQHVECIYDSVTTNISAPSSSPSSHCPFHRWLPGGITVVPFVRELHTIGPEPPRGPPDPRDTVSRSMFITNNVTPFLTKPCLTLPKQQYFHEMWNTKMRHVKLCDAPHCPLPTSETCPLHS